jgi:cell division protein FtsB
MTRVSFFIRREWLSLIFALVLGVLLLNVLAGPQGPRELMELRMQRAALESRRAQLVADNSMFRTNVQRLRSDDRFIERLIRRELGYARAGELVYKFTGQPDPASR